MVIEYGITQFAFELLCQTLLSFSSQKCGVNKFNYREQKNYMFQAEQNIERKIAYQMKDES